MIIANQLNFYGKKNALIFNTKFEKTEGLLIRTEILVNEDTAGANNEHLNSSARDDVKKIYSREKKIIAHVTY